MLKTSNHYNAFIFQPPWALTCYVLMFTQVYINALLCAMPCSVCERWIEETSRIIILRWFDNIIIGFAAFSGEEVVSFDGLDHKTECSEVRVHIANHLRISAAKLTCYKYGQVMSNSMPLGDLDEVIVKVVEKSGWLRWRLCECEPPPDFIRRVTISPRHQRQWYFICDECQARHPHLQAYWNINCEGHASSGSEGSDE
jgi:hypothetical protein